MENNKKIKMVLASRSNRLGAALLDSLVIIFIVIFIYVQLGWWDKLIAEKELVTAHTVFNFFLSFFIWLIINHRLLEKNGQTLGKFLFGIRVVDIRTMQTPPLRILIIKRFLVFQLLGMLPILSVIVIIGDALPIFSKNRLCVHDMYAGTIVVNAT